MYDACSLQYKHTDGPKGKSAYTHRREHSIANGRVHHALRGWGRLIHFLKQLLLRMYGKRERPARSGGTPRWPLTLCSARRKLNSLSFSHIKPNVDTSCARP